MEMIFKTNSQEEQLEALKLLESFGWANPSEETAEKYAEWDGYQCVKLDFEDKEYDITTRGLSTVQAYSEILPKLVKRLVNPSPQFFIELNDTYTAKVSMDGIKVGGQTFPLRIAKELWEAVQTFDKN